MGGCLVRSHEKTMGVMAAMKKLIAGMMVSKKASKLKDDSDQYEREMLLSSDGAEICAGRARQ